jgi:hypothetical protein
MIRLAVQLATFMGFGFYLIPRAIPAVARNRAGGGSWDLGWRGREFLTRGVLIRRSALLCTRPTVSPDFFIIRIIVHGHLHLRVRSFAAACRP